MRPHHRRESLQTRLLLLISIPLIVWAFAYCFGADLISLLGSALDGLDHFRYHENWVR